MEKPNQQISKADHQIIQTFSPVLSGLFTAMYKSLETDQMSIILKDLCLFMQNCLDKTFNGQDSKTINEINEIEHRSLIENLPSFSVNTNQNLVSLWDTGVYFPKRRIFRKVAEVNIGNVSKEAMCTKIAKKPGTMAAGLLWYFCGTHNKCVGFSILNSAESCKIVSETIISRFDVPPEIIIYDNCCNLEEYILNRFPEYFKKTKFFVDGFHHKSHTNCANTYDSGIHQFIKCNSSLVEQKNSKLRHLKDTTPFLKARTFFSKIVYAVHKINND